MDGVTAVHDVGKAECICVVQSERIRSDRDSKGHASTGREYPAELPAACGPAQNARKSFGAGNLPRIIDDHVVGLIEVRRPASKPRIEEELTGEAILELIAVG